MIDMDTAAYALGVGALAMMAAVATVALYGDFWKSRRRIWAVLHRRPYQAPRAASGAIPLRAPASTLLRTEEAGAERNQVEAA